MVVCLYRNHMKWLIIFVLSQPLIGKEDLIWFPKIQKKLLNFGGPHIPIMESALLISLK